LLSGFLGIYFHPHHYCRMMICGSSNADVKPTFLRRARTFPAKKLRFAPTSTSWRGYVVLLPSLAHSENQIVSAIERAAE
jgi:hypothetical protein